MSWEPLHSGWFPDPGSLQSSPPASCSWRVSSSTQRSWASDCWKRQADEAFQYSSHTRVLPQSSCNGHWRGFPELMKPSPCSVQCKKHLTLSSDASYFTAVGIKFHSSSFSSFIRAPHNPPQAWLHEICRCQYCPSFPDQSLWAPLNSAEQLRTQRGGHEDHPQELLHNEFWSCNSLFASCLHISLDPWHLPSTLSLLGAIQSPFLHRTCLRSPESQGKIYQLALFYWLLSLTH